MQQQQAGQSQQPIVSCLDRGKSGVFADPPESAASSSGLLVSAIASGDEETQPEDDDPPEDYEAELSGHHADTYEVENMQVDELLNSLDSPLVKDVSDDEPLVPSSSSQAMPGVQPKPQPQKRKPKAKALQKVPKKKRHLTEKSPAGNDRHPRWNSVGGRALDLEN